MNMSKESNKNYAEIKQGLSLAFMMIPIDIMWLMLISNGLNFLSEIIIATLLSVAVMFSVMTGYWLSVAIVAILKEIKR